VKILNIGGGPKNVSMPQFYKGHDLVFLDIDPTWEPDIEADIRDLGTLPAGEYDGVYGSHILEHVAPHELAIVLAGALHVLKDGGFVDFRVPDVGAVVQAMAQNGGDLYTHLYSTPLYKFTARDVLWGYAAFVRDYGDCQCHRNGFTETTMRQALHEAGFRSVYAAAQHFEVRAIAGVNRLNPTLLDELWRGWL
jgi:predicted SAM-dependent methyltransferase